MTFRRTLAVGVGLGLLAPLAALPAGASTPVDPVVSGARSFVAASQQDDGGFDLSGFPGFETPDAVLALAEASVQDSAAGWDSQVAVAGVEAVQKDGLDGLDAIDDLVDADAGTTTVAIAARSAKVISLVAAPLGLDPADLDPSDDSAATVDLVARMDSVRQGDGSYSMGAQFNGLLYVAIALDSASLGGVPDALVAQIRTAQKDDGSWDYTGVTGATGDDVDTTALALVALRSAGLTAADADVSAGVAWLARAHQDSGAWQAFGSDDPNSTATASVALSDLGLDVTTAGWVTRFAPDVTLGSYASPYEWIRSQATAEGNIASPNDSFGLNTFPTSQSIQALSRQWYLSDEFDALVGRLRDDLGGGDPAAGALASGELGPNPSIQSARTQAATAVVYSQQGREAAAAQLFDQAFGRKIDPSGRAFWSARLMTITRPEMLAQLVGSAEYYRRVGSTSGEFVDAAYQTVLGRLPDPAGRAHWVGRVDAGASRVQVARALVVSSEFRRRTVDATYQDLLGRAPDAAGRAFWTDKLATTRVEVLIIQLASSSSYYLVPVV